MHERAIHAPTAERQLKDRAVVIPEDAVAGQM